MRKVLYWMMVVLSVIALSVFMVGCETGDNPDTEDVDNYFNENPADPQSHGSLPAQSVTLAVSASPSSLSSDGAKANLSVTKGTAPYSWTVQDINLGNIDTDAGSSVVYTRLNSGDNAVTVSDSQGRVGNVIITQP